MELHKLTEEALDQKELAHVLNAAALALKTPELLLRLYSSEEYSGAMANPMHRLRELKIKVDALLRLAEVSDEISFVSTETAEEADISLLTKSPDLITVKEQQEIEQHKIFLGIKNKAAA